MNREELRAIAERTLRHLYTGHPPNVSRDVEALARTTLEMLDIPAGVQAAIERRRRCKRAKQFTEYVSIYGMDMSDDDIMEAIEKDDWRIADHFLSLPIAKESK